jgi:hypothetical protein
MMGQSTWRPNGNQVGWSLDVLAERRARALTTQTIPAYTFRRFEIIEFTGFCR